MTLLFFMFDHCLMLTVIAYWAVRLIKPNKTSSHICVGMYRLFLIDRVKENTCGWAGPLMSVFCIVLPLLLLPGTSAHKTIEPSVHCCTESWRTGRKSSTFLPWWVLMQERSRISTGSLLTRYFIMFLSHSRRLNLSNTRDINTRLIALPAAPRCLLTFLFCGLTKIKSLFHFEFSLGQEKRQKENELGWICFEDALCVMTIFQVTIAQRNAESGSEEALNLRPTKLRPPATRKGLKTLLCKCIFKICLII